MTKVHDWINERKKRKEVVPPPDRMAEIILDVIKQEVAIWAKENSLTNEEVVEILKEQLAKYEDILQSSNQNMLIERVLAESHQQ